jgi:hypothetical protein
MNHLIKLKQTVFFLLPFISSLLYAQPLDIASFKFAPEKKGSANATLKEQKLNNRYNPEAGFTFCPNSVCEYSASQENLKQITQLGLLKGLTQLQKVTLFTYNENSNMIKGTFLNPLAPNFNDTVNLPSQNTKDDLLSIKSTKEAVLVENGKGQQLNLGKVLKSYLIKTIVEEDTKWICSNDLQMRDRLAEIACCMRSSALDLLSKCDQIESMPYAKFMLIPNVEGDNQCLCIVSLNDSNMLNVKMVRFSSDFTAYLTKKFVEISQ